VTPARDRVNTPRSSTGRRHRPSGWHDYSTLPRSRVPVFLSVFWMAYAGIMAVVDVVRDLGRGKKKRRPGAVVAPPARKERDRNARIDYTTRRPTPTAM
jgi:hypothetical protein